jgi:hypothetical protein
MVPRVALLLAAGMMTANIELLATDRPAVTLQASTSDASYAGYILTAIKTETGIPNGDTVVLNLEPPLGQSGFWQYAKVVFGTSDTNSKSYILYSPAKNLAVSDHVDGVDVPVKRYDFAFWGEGSNFASKSQAVYFWNPTSDVDVTERVSGSVELKLAAIGSSGTWKYSIQAFYRVPSVDDVDVPRAVITSTTDALMAGDNLSLAITASMAAGASISRIEVFDNETYVGDAVQSSTSNVWEYRLDNIQPDRHWIKVRVIDNLGRSSFSDYIDLFVDWFSAKINFQPPLVAGMTLDSEYIQDVGEGFGIRQGSIFGVRHYYGWSSSLVGSVALGRNGIDSDECFDSYIKMGDALGNKSDWEIQVPAGQYLVQLAVGDSSYGAERYELQIENIHKTVTTSNVNRVGWHEVVEVPVEVTDGRLTIKDIGKERPVKLNYVFIRQTGSDVTFQNGFYTSGARGLYPDSIEVSGLGDMRRSSPSSDYTSSGFDAAQLMFFYDNFPPSSAGPRGLIENGKAWSYVGAGAVASFGTALGGSAIYESQTYSFAVYAGRLRADVDNQFRVRVFNATTNQYIGVLPLPVGDLIGPSSAGWALALKKGLSKDFEDEGLGLGVNITRSYFDLSSPSPTWIFRFSAKNAGYIYLLESDSVIMGSPGLALTRFATSDSADHYILGGETYSPVLALAPETASRFSSKIRNYAFMGKLMPVSYYGASLDELKNKSVQSLRDTAKAILSINGSVFDLAQLTNPEAPELLPFKQIGSAAATPELRQHTLLTEFIQRYNSDPIALANYVQNEIELCDPISYNQAYADGEPSIDAGGVQRGALGVLLEKQGSPAEQCALLIYFLRSCGIPAAYVTTTRNNLLMQDSMMSRMLKVRLNNKLSTPSLVPVNYPWVVALIPNETHPGEHRWVHLFPWIKDTELTEGEDLYAKLPVDANSGWKWVYKYFHADPLVLPVQLRDSDGSGPKPPEVKQVYGNPEPPYNQPASPLPREYEDVAGRQDFDQPAVLWPRFVEWMLREVDTAIEEVGYSARNRSHLFARWNDFPAPTRISGDFKAVAGLRQIPRIFDTIRYQVTKVGDDGRDTEVLIDTNPMFLCDVINRKVYIERYDLNNSGKDDVRLTMGVWDPFFIPQGNSTRNWPMADQSLAENYAYGEASYVSRINDPIGDLRVRVVHDRDRQNMSLHNVSKFSTSDAVFDILGSRLATAYSPSHYLQNASIPGVQDTDFNKLNPGVHALCVHVGRVTQEMLLVHLREIARHGQSSTEVSPDISYGSKCFLMGMSYWAYLTDFSDRLTKLHKLTISSDYGHLFAGLGYNAMTGKPQLPVVDIYRAATAGHLFSGSINPPRYDYSKPHEVSSYNHLIGCQGSAYEHGVIDKYFGSLGAISTMRLFHMAKDRGDSLIEIRADNYQEILNTTTLHHEAQGANVFNPPTALNLMSFSDDIRVQFEAGTFLNTRAANVLYMAPKFYQFYSHAGFKLESAGLAPISLGGRMGGNIEQNKEYAYYTYEAEVRPVNHAHFIIDGEPYSGISSSSVGEDTDLTLTISPWKFDPVNNGSKVAVWRINGTAVGGGTTKKIHFNRDGSCTAGGIKVNLGESAKADIIVVMEDPKLPTPRGRTRKWVIWSTEEVKYTSYLEGDVKTSIVGATLMSRLPSPSSGPRSDFTAVYSDNWSSSSIAADTWVRQLTTFNPGYVSTPKSYRKMQFKIKLPGWKESDILEVGPWEKISTYSNP